MMLPHIIHIIQRGETLERIAEKYNISVEILRRYHNTYCELTDLIEGGINHHKEIFIPIIPQEIINPQKVLLSYMPEYTYYQYDVTIAIEEKGKKDEINYKAEVKWIQRYKEYHIFEIDRNSKMYINKEEVNLIADVLAYKTSKVLYPMHILVSDKARMVDIATYNKYRIRWKKVKEEVLKEFAGEVVEFYLKKMEEILKTPDQLMSYLSKDFFLRALFLGYCENFTECNIFEKHIHFPIVESFKEANYKTQVRLADSLDGNNLLHLGINGVLESEEEDIKAKGHLYGSYFLNPNNGMPESLHLEINTGTEKKITIVIIHTTDEKIRLKNPKNSLFIEETDSSWISIKDKLK